MIVLSIMGILASVAIPSFDYIIKKNRVANAVNSVAATVAIGRGEAIRRNRTVMICPLDPGSSGEDCADGGGTDWGSGWAAFVDVDHDSELGPDDVIVNIVRADLLNASILSVNPMGRILLRSDGTVSSADNSSAPKWEIAARGVAAGSMFEALKRTVTVSFIGTVSVG